MSVCTKFQLPIACLEVAEKFMGVGWGGWGGWGVDHVATVSNLNPS